MRFVAIFLIALSVFASCEAASADSACVYERAARIFASAYESGNPNDTLFKSGGKGQRFLKDIVLDGRKIVISHEHSIVEDEEKPLVVTGYAALTAWLNKLHTPDGEGYLYGIKVRTLGECKAGCCEFPFIHGISHNTLYLKQVCFGTDRKSPYLKTVVLYDGD